MRIQLPSIFLVLAALLSAACNHQKIRYDQNGFVSNSSQDDGLQAQVIWLKNKKDQIDILVNLYNKYQEPIRFKASGISLTFNGQNLPLKRSDFTGQMVPNSLERQLLIFSKPGNTANEGVALLTIGDITSDFGKDSKIAKPSIPPLKIELEVRGPDHAPMPK